MAIRLPRLLSAGMSPDWCSHRHPGLVEAEINTLEVAAYMKAVNGRLILSTADILRWQGAGDITVGRLNSLATIRRRLACMPREAVPYNQSSPEDDAVIDTDQYTD